MSERMRVCFIGLGPVGQRCVAMALQRRELEIVSAADINPKLFGRDLGEIIGKAKIGVKISDTMDEALSASKKGVVVLCTTSSLEKATEQIHKCLQAGWHVVSTCEELVYPWNTSPQLSSTIDKWAKESQCSVIGTGVNPGFVMDALPVFFTSACQRVDTILIERFQDASLRRLPFQQKIGAGLRLEEFEKKVSEGIIRHVGFRESIHMISAALNLRIEKVQEIVMPVIATKELKSDFMKIIPGMVAGVNQFAQGLSNGTAVITLNLQAYFGHPQPQERVVIKGEPNIEMLIPGGIHGDVATCAMILNVVYRMSSIGPGLRTMLDVGLTSGKCF